jgi:hypothetical protein
MGFYFQIYAYVPMNETTGLPMMGWPPLPYNPQHYVVPQKYREFLSTRVGYISCYTKGAEIDMRNFHMKVNELLEYFPTWQEVTEMWNGVNLDIWNEEKHTLFKEALEWFASKNCFMASWWY